MKCMLLYVSQSFTFDQFVSSTFFDVAFKTRRNFAEGLAARLRLHLLTWRPGPGLEWPGGFSVPISPGSGGSGKWFLCSGAFLLAAGSNHHGCFPEVAGGFRLYFHAFSP